MTALNILGVFLVGIVFLLIFGMTVKVAGWKVALGVWGTSAILTGIITLGFHLIEL